MHTQQGRRCTLHEGGGARSKWANGHTPRGRRCTFHEGRGAHSTRADVHTQQSSAPDAAQLCRLPPTLVLRPPLHPSKALARAFNQTFHSNGKMDGGAHPSFFYKKRKMVKLENLSLHNFAPARYLFAGTVCRFVCSPAPSQITISSPLPPSFQYL